MMWPYFFSFVRYNRVKIVLLVLSLGLYFALVSVALTLSRSIPEIAAMPLRGIGVETIVQKTGKIPERMTGVIFPHSNAPIGNSEIESLKKLGFVQDSDQGLYLWVFDTAFFKAVLGVADDSRIFADILKKNIVAGQFNLAGDSILISGDFARKHGIAAGGEVVLEGHSYPVKGVLRSGVSGNIIPADIYMNLNVAVTVARESEEMRKLYRLDGGEEFGNVVLLKTDPSWQGDREKAIKVLDKDLLVFSEKTFSKEVMEQLKLASDSGRILFILLGALLLIAFCLLILFNLKTREKEIAILRLLGWRLIDLKRHFLGENLVLTGVALVVGNLLGIGGLLVAATRTISMELPWDISARPHFLVAENAIERVVTAPIPVHFDWRLFSGLSVAFMGLFLLVGYALFYRLGKIKPSEIQAG